MGLGVAYAVLVLAAAALAATRFGSGNPDFLYYQAMALQYVGVPFDDAVRAVAGANTWFDEPIQMDYGFLSPDIAALIYPRYLMAKVLSLAWTVAGWPGIHAVPLVLGAANLGGLSWLALARFGRCAGLLAPLLALTTALFYNYAFGPYTEALVLLLMLGILALLPIDGPVPRANAATVAALVLAMALVRQSPQIPVLMIGAGWLHAAWGTRRLRNDWLPFLVIGCTAAVAGYAVVSAWAPYDPLPYLHGYYGIEGNLLVWEFGHLWDAGLMLVSDWRALDPVAIPIVAFAVAGAWLHRRTAWPWLWAGTAAAAVLTIALNRPEYRFWTPTVLIGLLLAASSGARIADRLLPPGSVLRRSGHVGSRTPEPTPSAGSRSWLLAGVAGVLLAATAASALVDHRPGPARISVALDSAVPRAKALQYGIDPAARLFCAGTDAQIWLEEPSGSVFAVTGTAQKRMFAATLVYGNLPWPHTVVDGLVYIPEGLEGFYRRCRH